MAKRIFKRIFVFAVIACLLLACVPSVAFAVDPVSGAAALAGAMDAYGMAYGVGTVYDVTSSSGVTSSFEGLWDDFASYQSNNGSEFDYDSFISDYNQNRSLYGFEHSSGTFAAWHIDSESAEIFDQFWNWLLTGPAEMTRVDNEYFEFSSSQIGPDSFPISVYSLSSGFLGQPVSYQTSTFSSSISGYPIGSTSLGNGQLFIGYTANTYDVYFFTVGTDLYMVNTSGYFGPNEARYRFYYYPGSSSYSGYGAGGNSTTQGSYTFYYRTIVLRAQGGVWGNYSVSCPNFASASLGFLSLSEWLSDPVSENSSVGVLAYGDGIVNLPDPYASDYVPTPLEIVTNVSWDSSYDDTDDDNGAPVPFPPVDVPLVVDDVLASISAEDYALEVDPNDPDPDPPPPAPSEVFVPLLPVGLPSFNFSFSGIWHYVREWVFSLGAWFTTLFTIWGALPYAMVVPVYATAVVVIVLGVYKRFFM